MKEIHIFSFYGERSKIETIEKELNNWLEAVGPKILIHELDLAEIVDYNLKTPQNYVLTLRYSKNCYEAPLGKMRVKLFEEHNPVKLENQINEWLKDNHGRIKIMFTKITVTSFQHRLTMLYKEKTIP